MHDLLVTMFYSGLVAGVGFSDYLIWCGLYTYRLEYLLCGFWGLWLCILWAGIFMLLLSFTVTEVNVCLLILTGGIAVAVYIILWFTR